MMINGLALKSWLRVVLGHWKMVPFESLDRPTVSYSCSIVTMAAALAISITYTKVTTIHRTTAKTALNDQSHRAIRAAKRMTLSFLNLSSSSSIVLPASGVASGSLKVMSVYFLWAYLWAVYE